MSTVLVWIIRVRQSTAGCTPLLLLYHQRGPTLTLCHLQFANDTNICISSLERILDYQSVTLYPIRFRYVSLDVLSSISHISTSSSLRQTRTCVTSLSRQDIKQWEL